MIPKHLTLLLLIFLLGQAKGKMEKKRVKGGSVRDTVIEEEEIERMGRRMEEESDERKEKTKG